MEIMWDGAQSRARQHGPDHYHPRLLLAMVADHVLCVAKALRACCVLSASLRLPSDPCLPVRVCNQGYRLWKMSRWQEPMHPDLSSYLRDVLFY